MRKCLTSIAFALVMVVNIACGEEKTEKISDWCSVTYPTTVKIGEKFTCKIKLTGADTSMFVKSDLHAFNGNNGYAGWNASGGKQHKVVNDTEIAFSYTAVSKEDIAFVKALFYLSATGNYSKATKKTWSPVISITE